jgi:hypothetical protein
MTAKLRVEKTYMRGRRSLRHGMEMARKLVEAVQLRAGPIEK